MTLVAEGLIVSFHLHPLQLSNPPLSVYVALVPSTYCRTAVLPCCYLLRGDDMLDDWKRPYGCANSLRGRAAAIVR